MHMHEIQRTDEFVLNSDWETLYPKLSRHIIRQILQDLVKEKKAKPEYFDSKAESLYFHRRAEAMLSDFSRNEAVLRSYAKTRELRGKYPNVSVAQIRHILFECAQNSEEKCEQHYPDIILSTAEKRVGELNVLYKDMSKKYHIEGAFDPDDELLLAKSETAVFIHILIRDTVRNPFFWGDIGTGVCCNLWRLAILSDGPKNLPEIFAAPTVAAEIFFASILFLVLRNSVTHAKERVNHHRSLKAKKSL